MLEKANRWSTRYEVQKFISVLNQRHLGLDPEFESREGQGLSFLHNVQTGSGTHPISYSMSTADDFVGGKNGEFRLTYDIASFDNNIIFEECGLLEWGPLVDLV
jgi:hypothetical protein